ncbi:MAG: Fic family protein [Eubacterium sp.]
MENIYATFDGIELYLSKEEKAARLGFSLISNHAFVDGNKRIGIYIRQWKCYRPWIVGGRRYSRL